MKALAQSEIIALITDLNVFADGAETLINITQTNYDKDKKLLLNGHSSALSSLDSTYKANCAAVQSKSKLPIMMSTKNAPVWIIVNDNSNSSIIQSFTHSIMYGLLSSCPVEKLTYTIVYPENRGNSISPFFDTKNKLLELFGERIYVSKDEVAAKIGKLNEKIENVLQERLGNQYDTIFEYASNTSDYDLNIELVMLYDFPKGFDERTLAELRNILRNGSKCGIYIVISFMPVTKVNVCVFDSEQRGNSIILFLDFRKRSSETFDQKIYTSQ